MRIWVALSVLGLFGVSTSQAPAQEMKPHIPLQELITQDYFASNDLPLAPDYFGGKDAKPLVIEIVREQSGKPPLGTQVVDTLTAIVSPEPKSPVPKSVSQPPQIEAVSTKTSTGQVKTTPGIDKTSAETNKAIPAANQASTGQVKTTPGIDKTSAETNKTIPTANQASTEQVITTPGIDKTSAETNKTIPTANQASTGQVKTTPGIDKTSAETNKTIPTANQASTGQVKTTPGIDKTSAETNKTTPTANQASTEQVKTTPGIDKTSAETNKTTPTANQASTWQVKTTPGIDKTSAETNKTIPTANQASTGQVKTTPGIDKTSAETNKTIPEQQKKSPATPPPQKEAKPTTESASQIPNPAQPAKTETIPKRKPTDPVLPTPDFSVDTARKLIVPTNPDQVKIDRVQPITLEEAIQISERNSRQLRDSQLQVERARGVLQESASALNPTLNATADYTFNESAQTKVFNIAGLGFNTANPTQPVNAAVEFNYNIFTNGRVQADIRAAQTNIRLREADLNRIRQTVRIDVIRAYYNLQNADEQVRIQQKSVENNTRNLQDTKALERAGVGTKFDVLQAEVQLANSEQALQQAQATQYNNRRNLARLIEFPTNVDLTAADPIVPTKDWEVPLAETIIQALRNRSDLDVSRLQKLLAQEQARSTAAQLGPQVSVFANANTFDDFVRPGGFALGYAFGARFNLSLLDGGIAEARINQRRADEAIADNQFQLTINQVRFDVEQAFSNLQSNRQQIATSSKAVESAAEALRLARLRLSAGVGTQLEVIRAEDDLVRADVNKLSAIIGFNQSIADLRRATNEL